MQPSKQQNDSNDTQFGTDSLFGAIEFLHSLAVCGSGVIAAPFETLIRSDIGTRYQPIVVAALAPVLPLGLVAASLGWSVVGHAHGVIGMGIFYLILMAFTWKHYFHVINMIAHPMREPLSREDGRPLFFLEALPNGDKWPMVRFIYEPLLLLLAAVVLTPLRVITPILGVYLAVGAVALILRSAFLYFFAWEKLRDILDEFNLATAISENRTDPGSEEAIRRAVKAALQRVPAMVPKAVFQSVLKTARGALPAGLQSLIDEASV